MADQTEAPSFPAGLDRNRGMALATESKEGSVVVTFGGMSLGVETFPNITDEPITRLAWLKKSEGFLRGLVAAEEAHQAWLIDQQEHDDAY